MVSYIHYTYICTSLYSQRPFFFFFHLRHVNVPLFLPQLSILWRSSLLTNPEREFPKNASCWHHRILQSLNSVKTIRSRLEIHCWIVRSSWFVSHLPTKSNFLLGNCHQQKLRVGDTGILDQQVFPPLSTNSMNNSNKTQEEILYDTAYSVKGQNHQLC